MSEEEDAAAILDRCNTVIARANAIIAALPTMSASQKSATAEDTKQARNRMNDAATSAGIM